MKYIVGAGIGGLFGISVPMMMNVDKDLVDDSPRIEVPQQTEATPPIPIENKFILPDNICGYINYTSDNIKEQAKECLEVDIPAIPAI
tara:strand:+ start:706 stop:969 length:264 start_codon:yes stop_codon:yes gene_type:complete